MTNGKMSAAIAALALSAIAQEPTQFAPVNLYHVMLSDYNMAVITQLSGDQRNEISLYCFPSFRTEWALTLSGDAITLTEAAQPIWTASEIRTNVATTVHSIILSTDIAAAVKSIFRSALAHAEYQDDDRHICDGESYWLIDRSGRLAQSATPSEGTVPGKVVRFAHALRDLLLNDTASNSDRSAAIQKCADEYASQPGG